MSHCAHVMSYDCRAITSQGTRSAWFTKCVGCNTRRMYSSDVYKCTECQVFVHKKCWEYGQACAQKAFNEQSATIATGVEASKNAEPHAREMVDVHDVSTETIVTRSVDVSTQTDFVVDQCQASVQTEFELDQCDASAQTNELAQCHASSQTNELAQCHSSMQTDFVLDQSHASVQTEFELDQRHASAQTDELDQCHSLIRTDDVLDQSRASTRTDKTHPGDDGSVVPPHDVPMCEKIDNGHPVVASIGKVDESFPCTGGLEAGHVDVGPVVKDDCTRTGSWTKVVGKMTMTPKQRARKIQVEEETALMVEMDSVSALQALCMARWWKAPEFHYWNKTADNMFQVDCSLMGCTVKGVGVSKKEAKHKAAYNAYKAVKNENVLR